MHNFALVAYDPSALGPGASVVRAAELLPGKFHEFLLPDMCSSLSCIFAVCTVLSNNPPTIGFIEYTIKFYP